MLLLDHEKGGNKKTYKTSLLCHPLLERRKRVKRRERPEVKKTPPFLHCFSGASKAGRKYLHLFGPQFQFSKSAKTSHS